MKQENLTLVCVIEPEENLNRQIVLKLSEQKLNVKGFLDMEGALNILFNWEMDALVLIDYKLFKENEIRLSDLSNYFKDRIKFILMADNSRKDDFCIKDNIIIKNQCFLNLLPYLIDKTIYQFKLNQKLVELQGELKESLERYQLVIEGSSDGIFEWNIKNNSMFYSKQYKNALGLSPNDKFETLGDWIKLLHPEDKEHVLSTLRDYLGRKIENYCVEYRISHKDGEYKWMLTKGQAIWDKESKPLRIAGSHTDITERKINDKQLFELAYLDKVTGLHNRAYFLEKINEVIEQNEVGKQFAVLFIDLDKFKEVNDTLGHDIGDLLLRDVSKILKNHVSEEDIVVRLGGDEFIILKRIVNHVSEIREFCEEIDQQFVEPWFIHGRKFYITLSIGIAIYPRDGIDCRTLMKNADMAMYRAKELGRNKFVFFSSYINKDLVSRIEINSELKAALKNEEFVLYYQPLIDVATKKTIGAEALIRWKHPTKGIIMPGQFIQEAENSELIIPIGEWVLKTAINQLKEWKNKGYTKLPLSVNVSALSFQQPNFIEYLKRNIEEAGISTDLLELEITESTVLKDISHTRLVLDRLKEMGIRVYLDDFGTGYSSLNYLSKLPIYGFKLDRGFIEEIPANQMQAAIAKALITLAQDLNLKVTAEGVEVKKQEEFLESNKFNRIQGYLYSKPLPKDEFVNWLDKS